MPTYQYQCTECGENLEAVQKFTDEALTDCPSCAGRLRKVYSAVGVVFKGSGFYRTDSRSASTGGSASKEPKEKVGGGDGGSDKTPAKTSTSGSSDSSGSSGSSGSSDSKAKSSAGSSASSTSASSAA